MCVETANFHASCSNRSKLNMSAGGRSVEEGLLPTKTLTSNGDTGLGQSGVPAFVITCCSVRLSQVHRYCKFNLQRKTVPDPSDIWRNQSLGRSPSLPASFPFVSSAVSLLLFCLLWSALLCSFLSFLLKWFSLLECCFFFCPEIPVADLSLYVCRA